MIRVIGVSFSLRMTALFFLKYAFSMRLSCEAEPNLLQISSMLNVSVKRMFSNGT